MSSSSEESRVFIYPFHTEFETIEKYFTMNFRCSVSSFSLENVEKALQQDSAQGKKVVVLLTSSANYVGTFHAHVVLTAGLWEPAEDLI